MGWRAFRGGGGKRTVVPEIIMQSILKQLFCVTGWACNRLRNP